MADDNRTPNGDKDPGTNNWMKSLLIWAAIILALVLFVQMMGGSSTQARDSIPYSDFLNRVEEGSVKQVIIGKEEITGRTTNNETFRTNSPPSDPQLVTRLRERGGCNVGGAGERRISGRFQSRRLTPAACDGRIAASTARQPP